MKCLLKKANGVVYWASRNTSGKNQALCEDWSEKCGGNDAESRSGASSRNSASTSSSTSSTSHSIKSKLKPDLTDIMPIHSKVHMTKKTSQELQ